MQVVSMSFLAIAHYQQHVFLADARFGGTRRRERNRFSSVVNDIPLKCDRHITENLREVMSRHLPADDLISYYRRFRDHVSTIRRIAKITSRPSSIEQDLHTDSVLHGWCIVHKAHRDKTNLGSDWHRPLRQSQLCSLSARPMDRGSAQYCCKKAPSISRRG